ncbi:hypothetical protein [Formosa sp. S-31]|uniref:hypothetical protein n=1 Tax=Formosa sp. S-31 TaxID=2790949 RepID=UPI003EB914BE
MKKIILIFLVLCGIQLSAQTAELEAFKDMFNSEKKIALGEFLDLDATQAMVFWEIYDDYSEERKEVANQRMALLKEYVAEYNGITNDQADDIVEESFSIRAKSDKIQKKYYKKIKKELGAVTASKFVQFERYVQTSIDVQLQSALPLIGQ